MKIVTKIEKLKGKKGYRKIIFSDSSAMEIDRELISYFCINESSQLNDNEFKKIKELTSRKLAKDRVLEFLRYKSRSESEIRKKLFGLRVKNEIIDEIINDLKRVGFINDNEFALRFSYDFINRRPAGDILLKNELRKRGISEDVINKTIEKIYSELDKKELALKLVNKKRFDLSTGDPKIKKKIADLLLRRGFDWGIVREVLQADYE